MSLICELHGELATEFVKRAQASENVDGQAMLAMLEQIQATLRPLVTTDRRLKIFQTPANNKTIDCAAQNGH